MTHPKRFLARQITAGAVFVLSAATVIAVGAVLRADGSESSTTPVPSTTDAVPTSTTLESSTTTPPPAPSTTDAAPESTVPASSTTVPTTSTRPRPGPTPGTTPPDTAAPVTSAPTTAPPPEPGTELPSDPPFAIAGTTYYDRFRGGDSVTFHYYYTSTPAGLCDTIQNGMRGDGWEVVSVNCAGPSIDGIKGALGMWVSHDPDTMTVRVNVYL